MMDEAKIAELKIFVKLLKDNPSILSLPSLKFFREYLESLGATIPQESKGSSSTTFEASETNEEELVESDVEFEGETVVDSDNDPPQQMGDSNKEVSEDDRENAQLAKSLAIEALAQENYEEAITHFTEAITLNPQSALLYANRAGVYVKLKKPNSAIRDCEAALKINPDSARAYKSRGQAKALLGEWEGAVKDLRVASNIDYDEELAALLKTVEANAHKLEVHRKKYEKLRAEKEEKKREKERQKKASEEKSKAKKGTAFPGGMPAGMGGMPAGMGGMPAGMGGMPAGMGRGMPAGMGGMPAGMGGIPKMPGGMGGFPGGGGMPDMSALFQDPEIMASFSDPEIMAALQDVMRSPSNIGKYSSNPKVMNFINKIQKKATGSS